MADQGQGGKPETSGPAFGALDQTPEGRILDLHAGCVKKGSRLGQVETEVGRSDLGQLTVEPQAV